MKVDITMPTITEDYVSFEVVKLLKSKKFHVPTRSHYDGHGGFGFLDICEIDWNSYKCFRERRCYSAPTLQMAMKWLREVHNIVVEPFIQEDVKYVWYIHRIETMFNKKYLVFCWGSKNNKYERREQAVDAGIKYCLENIIK